MWVWDPYNLRSIDLIYQMTTRCSPSIIRKIQIFKYLTDKLKRRYKFENSKFN